MANVEGNGKIMGFTYSERDLLDKITEYKQLADEGSKLLPSWPDFCSFIDVDSETLEEVMQRGSERKNGEKSTYYARAEALKSMRRWCEAQLVSNPNWGGKMGVKSMMLLKQGFGGGRKYLDERTAKPSGPDKIEVSFGGGDPRGKKAAK